MGMRYRLLETVRQYAQEKLGESGEGDEVRTRHRDYYAATHRRAGFARACGRRAVAALGQAEIDNLRAAYVWSRENSDPETALRLVSSLQQFWIRRGVFREALAGFDAILDHQDPETIAPEVWARAVADHGATADGWPCPRAWSERRAPWPSPAGSTIRL